jgi:hypothetical protein
MYIVYMCILYDYVQLAHSANAGMGEFTLGPLIAIALSKDPHAAQAGKQVLR